MGFMKNKPINDLIEAFIALSLGIMAGLLVSEAVLKFFSMEKL
jgi:hypothetical protein